MAQTTRVPAAPPRIIILHGASSGGKSTLARAVQAAIEVPFWHVSIDKLRDGDVLPSARIASGEFAWAAMRAAFFEGFHLSLRAYADAGNNLIVEHIFDTPGWLERVADLLVPFDVLFVAVHCSLPELIRREAARGDRRIGDAERDFGAIHQGIGYDFELSSEQPLADNVERLLTAWRMRRRSRLFERSFRG